MAAEFRAKGANTLLGPSVNIHRVARGGRNGEYVNGVQEQHKIPQALNNVAPKEVWGERERRLKNKKAPSHFSLINILRSILGRSLICVPPAKRILPKMIPQTIDLTLFHRYISGEDPYLGAELASVYVTGVQSQKVMAVMKHYALNNQETHRNDGYGEGQLTLTRGH